MTLKNINSKLTLIIFLLVIFSSINCSKKKVILTISSLDSIEQSQFDLEVYSNSKYSKKNDVFTPFSLSFDKDINDIKIKVSCKKGDLKSRLGRENIEYIILETEDNKKNIFLEKTNENEYYGSLISFF